MKIAKLGERGSLLKDKNGYLKAVVSVNGKQYQKRVRSEDEGRQFVLSVELERNNRDELSAKQLNDASNALHLLKKAGVSVSFCDLARYYIDNAFEGIVTVNEALVEFGEFCKTRLSADTCDYYNRYLGMFSKEFGECKVAAITKKNIISFLSRYEDKRGSWMNCRNAVSKFFTECVKLDYCHENPCRMIEPPRQTKAPDRRFFTPENAAKLLYLLAEKRKKYVPFVALGLFGGLRPIEAYRLKLANLNMETRYIKIAGDATKSHTFKERLVPINDTLYAWLKAFPYAEMTKVSATPNSLAEQISDFCKEHGIPKHQDDLRHSFETYEFARTGNSAQTAAICGHSERIAIQHYRGLATKEEALKYFAIRPKENVESDLDDL